MLLASGRSAPYCIYGAGKFTKEIIAFLQENHLPLPDFIFDDRPSLKKIADVDVLPEQEASFENISSIILGTDTWQTAMRERLDKINPRKEILDITHTADEESPPATIYSDDKIKLFLEGDMKPWTEGYWDYRNMMFEKAVNTPDVIDYFRRKQLPGDYGFRLCERIIEYPWLFSKLEDRNSKILDAGSILNFRYLLEHPVLKNKKLSILTLAPEGNCFFDKSINYLYEDLRNIPFQNTYFDEIICISTLEHINMDNTIYGEEKLSGKTHDGVPDFAYADVIKEFIRILKPCGKIYITVPYGKFENHGFFQQFDRKMLEKITDMFSEAGTFETDFFRYFPDGWRFISREDCDDAESFNPHTGRGWKDDFAAHSRGICAIEFKKNKTGIS